MAKIEVKEFRSTATQTEKEPQWHVVVLYGRDEIEIPLPEVHLIGDDLAEIHRGPVEALESLARALLDFAARIRSGYPSDFC